jgi:hypothetical protein
MQHRIFLDGSNWNNTMITCNFCGENSGVHSNFSFPEIKTKLNPLQTTSTARESQPKSAKRERIQNIQIYVT